MAPSTKASEMARPIVTLPCSHRKLRRALCRFWAMKMMTISSTNSPMPTPTQVRLVLVLGTTNSGGWVFGGDVVGGGAPSAGGTGTGPDCLDGGVVVTSGSVPVQARC